MENFIWKLSNPISFGLFLSLINSYYAQITIIEPQSLINALNSTKISGSTATFGTPYYGSRLVGVVKYFDTMGCNQTDYKIEEDEMPVIAVVWRGGCDFIEKTYLAEKSGADALIIIDSKGSNSTYPEIRKVIMSKGSSTRDVDIPALFIGEVEGLKVIEAFNGSKEIIMGLSWSMPKSEWSEMDLWMSPAVLDSMKFIEDFSIDALELEEKMDFYPHYWVISLKQNYQDKCWDEEGRFCSLNAEWDHDVTGRQILEEIVREVCLYETTQSYDYPQYYSEVWWKYMSQLRNTCMVKDEEGTSKFGEKCSYNLMEDIGVNVQSIQECYQGSADDILRHELLTSAWSPIALIINGWHYSGELEADTVAKAVCTGYSTPPKECVHIFNRIENKIDTTEEIKSNNSIGIGSIIALSLIASAITLTSFGVLFWKFLYPKIKRNMRYVVMNEVHKEVQRHKGDPLAFEKREIGQSRQYLF